MIKMKSPERFLIKDEKFIHSQIDGKVWQAESGKKFIDWLLPKTFFYMTCSLRCILESEFFN